MKNNTKTGKLVAMLLLVTMILLVLLSGTYAKYTSQVRVSDTSTVAKWSFKVSGTEIAVTEDPETVTFNLFETIKDTKDGKTEKDVINNKIAPGTQGSFKLTLANESEVNATYEINYKVEKSDSSIPIQFCVDGENWTNDLADVEATAIKSGANESINVQWKWVFNGDDGVDTALGIAAQNAAPEIIVSATVTATQVD